MQVSAFAPTTEAAMAIGPAAMTLFIVFGGLYVNSNNVPAFLRWLPKVRGAWGAVLTTTTTTCSPELLFVLYLFQTPLVYCFLTCSLLCRSPSSSKASRWG
jgi:hypothetical protein